MTAGDSIVIDTGSNVETRKIVSVGTAASSDTTVWQPLPDGPLISIPAGSTNVPVASVSGFEAGEKIALGYGATYPAVAKDTERYEVATVTAVGQPGTQAYLGADAPAGSTTSQPVTRSGWISTASAMGSRRSRSRALAPRRAIRSSRPTPPPARRISKSAT